VAGSEAGCIVDIETEERQRGISRQEALDLLTLQEGELELLIRRAGRRREEHFGKQVRLCAISNAKSGACPEQCDFCAQSARFHTGAPVFPMKPAHQIAEEAVAAQAAGAREFSVVTSGRTLRREAEIDRMERALRLIGERAPRLERCASLGEIPAEVLLRLREAGLVRYHHNIETAPSFHASIVHTHTYDDEVRAVRVARESELKVCCGGILGMGESPAQRVEMAFALRELDPQCVPLNFLDPRPGTPLEGRSDLTPLECLRIIAIFRLVLPDKQIFVCGGRERNLGPLQRRMFEAGATGTMVGDYLTTKGEDAARDRQMIAEAGLCVETLP
jgi:biotin synthase